MAVNPLEYSSISKGTINLSGTSSSSSDKKSEDKKTSEKKASKEEDSYVDTDFSQNIEESIESLGETRDSIMSLISSLMNSAKSSVNSVGQNISSAAPSITGVAGDMADKLNQKFKGALAGKGEIIVGTAQKYGLDPALLAAIMALETGWGTSSAVNNQNNPGGLMDPSSNWMSLQSFSSIEAGIDAMAKNLKTGYIDQGLTSISQIGNKYCPVGAANDPNGTNGGWIPSVTSIYNQLKA